MLSHTVAADVPIGAVPIEVSRADSHPKSAQFEKFAPKPAAEEFDGGALYIMTHFMMVMSLVTTHAFLSRVGAIMTAMVGAKAFKPSLNQPVLFALSMIVGGVVVFQMFSVAIGH